MKRKSNDRKPGKNQLVFRKQAIRELKPIDFEQSHGAGAMAASVAGTDMVTMDIDLPFDDYFLC